MEGFRSMDIARITATKINIFFILSLYLCLGGVAYKAHSQTLDNKKVLLDLASLSFDKDDYSKSLHYLKRALKVDPSDAYAHELIAAIYFLQGNYEAALKHWDRTSSMPFVQEIKIDSSLKTDPIMLDRSFAFSPAARLFLADVETTKARIKAMNAFSVFKIELAARSDGNFDVNFNAVERGGGGKLMKLLTMFRGLPYQALHFDAYNINGRGINFESMGRWDKDKRRYNAFLSGPMNKSLKRFYKFNADVRNENWNLLSGGSEGGSFNMQKAAVGAEVLNVVNGRFSWSTGGELSYRNFRNSTQLEATDASQYYYDGLQLKHQIKASYDLIDNPEKRIETTVSISNQAGRMLSGSREAFSKLQGDIQIHWLPQSKGDDYEMRGGIVSGNTFGITPFDEMYILGYERDNDLLMRAYVGTLDGQKGNTPMGRSFVITNFEIDKNIYENGLIKFKLGPFFDSGKILSSDIGYEKWLYDVGLQSKVKVLGVGAAFSYGKDLRSGNNAFYISVGKQ